MLGTSKNYFYAYYSLAGTLLSISLKLNFLFSLYSESSFYCFRYDYNRYYNMFLINLVLIFFSHILDAEIEQEADTHKTTNVFLVKCKKAILKFSAPNKKEMLLIVNDLKKFLSDSVCPYFFENFTDISFP